jgi:hypothetical protein
MASRKKKRVRYEQLTLGRFTWGGARPGAGRKKSKTSGVSHTTRETITKHQPLHVTLKVHDGLESLRGHCEFEAVCLSFLAGKEKPGFRLVHFSVQESRVDPGRYRPGPPTDPDMRNSRIRLLRLMGSLRAA